MIKKSVKVEIDTKEASLNEKEASLQSPNVKVEEKRWECFNCGEFNPSNIIQCKFCGAQKKVSDERKI